jgi:hypothetical protein
MDLELELDLGSSTARQSAPTPAAITGQPSNSSIALGASAALTVVATGSGLTYQWYAGESGATLLPIEGATSATYDATPTGPTAINNYWCRVTGVVGDPVDSDTATVTISSASDAFASDANWTDDGVGTAAIANDEMDCSGTGGSGRWFNKLKAPATWETIRLNFQASLDSADNVDAFPAVTSDTNGAAPPTVSPYGDFTPGATNSLIADITGGSAVDKIYLTQADVVSTPYSASAVNFAVDTYKDCSLLLTKVDADTVNVKFFYDNSAVDSFGGSGQNVDVSDIVGSALWCGLHSWGNTGRHCKYKNFEMIWT